MKKIKINLDFGFLTENLTFSALYQLIFSKYMIWQPNCPKIILKIRNFGTKKFRKIIKKMARKKFRKILIDFRNQKTKKF